MCPPLRIQDNRRTPNALKGPIYHGKVFVKNFLSKQQEASSYHQITDEGNILHELDELHPEYIYVSIDQFDNETHGEELNEWLYLLKNSAIKKDFKSKSVLQASHRLNRIKMSKEALNAYDKHKYEELKRIGSIAVSREEGREEVEKKVEKKEKS